MSVSIDTRSRLDPAARTRTRSRERTGKRKRSPGTIAAFVVVLLLALVWLLPLAWALATALKPDAETTAVPVRWFGSEITFEGFTSVLENGAVWRWYFNSFLVSSVVTLVTIVLASMAAFAFSRVKFRGRGVAYFFIAAGLIVPFQALIVPLFQELDAFGLVDTYWGIILPQIAAPIAVLVFKRFFDGIPKELDESARLDGASTFRVYWQIWMPLAKPAIAAVGIFTFVTSWNNFLWPYIITSAGALQTIPVGLATVQSFYGAQYAQVMALSLLGALPLFIAFVLFQRQIVEGISNTGLKG
jgi:multiple sugar transport system permease protein